MKHKKLIVPKLNPATLERVRLTRQLRQQAIERDAQTTRKVELERIQSHLDRLSPSMRPFFLAQRVEHLRIK
jgi:hypothetical protein